MNQNVLTIKPITNIRIIKALIRAFRKASLDNFVIVITFLPETKTLPDHNTLLLDKFTLY